jgi:anti-anti-sigma factor
VQSQPIAIEVSSPGEEIVVVVQGDVDMATVPVLERALGRTPRPQATVVLDLSQVEFMGSCGVALLLRAQQGLAERGQDLVLRQPSEPVRRVLDLTGVSDLLARPSPLLHPGT